MCQLLPLPGLAWTPFTMLVLGFSLVFWATVFGGRLLWDLSRWDLSQGRVGPNATPSSVRRLLSGLASTPFTVLLLGFVFAVWATVYGGRLLWDLTRGRVGPNTTSSYVHRYLSGLAVGLLGWTIVYGGSAWNYGLSEWDGANLGHLLAHGCGIQQLLATYETVANLTFIPLIGGFVFVVASGFVMDRARRYLQRTVVGGSA